jgi:tetratricopeptide (TPR) repeat protein
LGRAAVKISLEHYQDALADVEKAKTLKYDSINLFNTRALCFIGLKRFDEALKDLDIVLKIDSMNYSAYYGRCTTYLWAKDFKNACLNCEQAKKLGCIEADKILSEYCK